MFFEIISSILTSQFDKLKYKVQASSYERILLWGNYWPVPPEQFSDMLTYAHSRLVSRFLSCSKIIAPQIRSIHLSVKQNSSVVVSRTGFRPVVTSNSSLNTTTTCRNMSLTTQTQFSPNFLFRQVI